jgi:tRNA(Arg) A34 adenosine deaminase TadA
MVEVKRNLCHHHTKELFMHPLLIKAGQVALSANVNDEKRNFLLGCVGQREDGSLTYSKNGAVITSSYNEYRIISDAHAEMRCLKKMGRGGILYTARVLKMDGNLAMARACPHCRLRIKMAGIEKVFYTIDQNHYGIYHVKTDTDKICEV